MRHDDHHQRNLLSLNCDHFLKLAIELDFVSHPTYQIRDRRRAVSADAGCIYRCRGHHGGQPLKDL